CGSSPAAAPRGSSRCARSWASPSFRRTSRAGGRPRPMADLLFEIGAEEIPARFVPTALEQLEKDLAAALSGARLSFKEVKAVGTPRRLAVWAKGVAALQPDAKSEALGPPVASAFDGDG